MSLKDNGAMLMTPDIAWFRLIYTRRRTGRKERRKGRRAEEGEEAGAESMDGGQVCCECELGRMRWEGWLVGRAKRISNLGMLVKSIRVLSEEI